MKPVLAAKSALGAAESRVRRLAGDRARLPVIALLASVLALDNADKGAVSAVADALKHAFTIGNTEIGLLLSVVSFIGAIATIPMGVLADRLDRRRILLVVICIWAATMFVTAIATSFVYLVLVRLALGAATAAAWPCIASLVGDFFPAQNRARVYGLIVAGELVGVGIGFFISGEVSSWLSWRWSFVAMGLPAAPLAWLIWRHLPEPRRGGQSWLQFSGASSTPSRRHRFRRHQKDSASAGASAAGASGSTPGGATVAPRMLEQIRQQRIQPRERLVLEPQHMPRTWWQVLGYLLRLPTYRLLIVASALVYYFFAGVRSFSMIYVPQHDHLARSAVSALVFIAGIAALVGVVGGGMMAERLARRGQISARINVPAVALFASVPLLGFGLWTHNAWVAIPLLAVGVAALAAAVPPIDAARLDIVPAPMWGRGEAGRIALRSLLEGGAPLLFGALSGWLGGGDRGLMWTFLLMLLPMLLAALLALPARRSYPIDVATAAATAEAAQRKPTGREQPSAQTMHAAS